MTREPLCALLLAGGQSRRMGQPKAYLDIHGIPLWQYQIRKLQALGPDQLFLSISGPFPDGPWTLVRDNRPDCGPLAGVLAAMLLVPAGSRLLVLAVDHAAVTVELLSKLLNLSSSRQGIVPRGKIYFEKVVLGNPFIGTVAVYPARILPLLEAAVQSEDRSFQTLIRNAAALIAPWDIPEDLENQFKNLNSPADLQEFLSDVG